MFCRGDHWSPADACGNGKPSGRIWNPPLQSPLGPLAEGAKGEHPFFDSLKPFSGSNVGMGLDPSALLAAVG